MMDNVITGGSVLRRDQRAEGHARRQIEAGEGAKDRRMTRAPVEPVADDIPEIQSLADRSENGGGVRPRPDQRRPSRQKGRARRTTAGEMRQLHERSPREAMRRRRSFADVLAPQS
jgi:hypothetical protein